MATDGHWMEKAVKHPGSFRKAMGKKAGQKITAADIAKGKRSKNPTTRRRAALAATFAKFRGGKHNPGYDAHRGRGAMDMDRELQPLGGSLTTREAAQIIGDRSKTSRARAAALRQNKVPGLTTQLESDPERNTGRTFAPRTAKFSAVNKAKIRSEGTATGGDLVGMGGMRSRTEAMEGLTPQRKRLRGIGKRKIKVSSVRGGGLPASASPLFGGY